jgi:multimeric flavodoxin WrbA
VKVAVLYDSGEEISEKLAEMAIRFCSSRNYETEITDAADKAGFCVGCFACWIKTPGLCIHKKDSGMNFLKKIYDADYLVCISKIRWGGYSPSIKRFADRMIPLLHPYFKKINGEMHHKLRYDKLPVILTAGYGASSTAEENVFREFADAQRDNMGSEPVSATFVAAMENGKLCGEALVAFEEWLEKEVK